MARLSLTKGELTLLHCIMFNSCGYEELRTHEHKSNIIKKIQNSIHSSVKEDIRKCTKCECPIEEIDGGSNMLCAYCGCILRKK